LDNQLEQKSTFITQNSYFDEKKNTTLNSRIFKILNTCVLTLQLSWLPDYVPIQIMNALVQSLSVCLETEKPDGLAIEINRREKLIIAKVLHNYSYFFTTVVLNLFFKTILIKKIKKK